MLRKIIDRQFTSFLACDYLYFENNPQLISLVHRQWRHILWFVKNNLKDGPSTNQEICKERETHSVYSLVNNLRLQYYLTLEISSEQLNNNIKMIVHNKNILNISKNSLLIFLIIFYQIITIVLGDDDSEIDSANVNVILPTVVSLTCSLFIF